MKEFIYSMIFTIANLLFFNQSVYANTNNETTVWKCPAASAIHVEKESNSSNDVFKWMVNLISNTGVSIMMQGYNNPKYPTSLRGVRIYANQVLRCDYNTSDRVCPVAAPCEKSGTIITTGASIWKPLPGTCHYTKTGRNKGWCLGNAETCSVSCT